jgi:folylpolyglutamate synthase
LRCVRDRYQINGVPLSEELFTKYLFEVWKKVIDPITPDYRPKPGYFTFLTLAFIHAFLEQGVTATIVETGVGGEYDSTNIVRQSVATAITKIRIDYVRTLRRNGEGDAKIEDIA